MFMRVNLKCAHQARPPLMGPVAAGARVHVQVWRVSEMLPNAKQCLRSSLPLINRSLFHETKRISPRVLGIERSLAPRAHDDATCRCIVHVLAR